MLPVAIPIAAPISMPCLVGIRYFSCFILFVCFSLDTALPKMLQILKKQFQNGGRCEWF